MTRVARALSELGHYHVMLKGCAGQLIFEDDDDRLFFSQSIEQTIYVRSYSSSCLVPHGQSCSPAI